MGASWDERWLSAARMRPYVSACGGDREAALELYRWNSGLAQALIGDIAVFEVALRNAYDRCLSGWPGSGSWLFDPASPVRKPIMRTNSRGAVRDLNSINRKLIDQAVLRKGWNADGVVSDLTFGFWMHLTDRSHERDVWIPHLHKAWPAGTNRAALHKRISTINEERNRVAHHERLYSPGRRELLPSSVSRDIVELLFMLDPEIAVNVYGLCGQSKTGAFLAENPCPANVDV